MGINWPWQSVYPLTHLQIMIFAILGITGLILLCLMILVIIKIALLLK